MKFENKVLFGSDWMSIKQFKDRQHSEVRVVTNIRDNKKVFQVMQIAKSVGPINQMLCYYTNGLRQYGKIWTSIIEMSIIKGPFWKFTQNANKFLTLRKKLSESVNKDENYINDIIEQMIWSLEDTSNSMKHLIENIHSSNVINDYYDERCIFENGKRLGLKTLVDRAEESLKTIDSKICSITNLLKNFK